MLSLDRFFAYSLETERTEEEDDDDDDWERKKSEDLSLRQRASARSRTCISPPGVRERRLSSLRESFRVDRHLHLRVWGERAKARTTSH